MTSRQEVDTDTIIKFATAQTDQRKSFPGLNTLFIASTQTPLGPVIIISHAAGICLMSFTDKNTLKQDIIKLKQQTKSNIINTSNTHIDLISQELHSYFNGQLQEFKTPLYLIGTDFQTQAWQALTLTSYGSTKTYQDQAAQINKPKSSRAVANANSRNPIIIVIPCHRIIKKDKQYNIGGYSCGIERKKWLIEHEKNCNTKRFT